MNLPMFPTIVALHFDSFPFLNLIYIQFNHFLSGADNVQRRQVRKPIFKNVLHIRSCNAHSS